MNPDSWLWNRTQVRWNRRLVKECYKLTKNMSRRVREGLRAKEGHTKY